MELGTEDQKQRWLLPLSQPDCPLTALAITEPEVGSDSAAMATRADRVEGGYRLYGQKTWISNGGVADFYGIFAKTDPTARAKGVTAFLVHKGAEGLSFGAPMKKMGQRAMVNCEVFLDGVFVPDEDRFGARARGSTG